MKDKDEKKVITIPIPEKLLNDVKKKAKQNDISMSQIVRKLLTDWVSQKQNTLNF